jgi:hypothetical protein
MSPLREHLGIYKNSIHIEINPSNDFFFNFDINNIPNILNICYCDVTDIINLFNSPRGFKILKMGMDGKIKINLFPTDSVGITEYEKNFLVGHESLFRNSNINLYQTWYDFDLNFNYYIGSTIHSALSYFIDYFRNNDFDETKKEKTLLTLNNFHTPDREELFKFYISLHEKEKEKFICSFRFKKIYLDNILKKEITPHTNLYNKNTINFYKNSLIEIVSESSYIATTEKTFKPLLAGVPFIHYIGDLDGTVFPIQYTKEIGIDTTYFDIDYSDKKNILSKIKEILKMSNSEILKVYQKDFQKAKENKIKFYKFLDNITTNLILD